MLRIPCDVALWREAYSDTALGKLFDREIRAEQMRWRIWSRDETPGREPFDPRTAAELLARAKATLTHRTIFDETAEGRFVVALRDLTELTVRLSMIAGQARAARDRSFHGSLPRLDALMKDAEAVVRDLKIKAGEAQIAIDDGYASEAA